MNEIRNRWLDKIRSGDEATKMIVESIEAVFRIEDMFTLARSNTFIALNFMQLICNLDYVIFTPTEASPVGTATTGAVNIIRGTFSIADEKFDFSIKGKLAAIAYCFKIQAAKLDTMITTETLSAFMQGTGAAQIAQDTAKALLNGGLDILKGTVQGAQQALPLLAAGA